MGALESAGPDTWIAHPRKAAEPDDRAAGQRLAGVRRNVRPMKPPLRSGFLLARRCGSRARSALQQLEADAAWLQRLVREELRPRPGRVRTSVRMALIGAVGTTVMVALHV